MPAKVLFGNVGHGKDQKHAECFGAEMDRRVVLVQMGHMQAIGGDESLVKEGVHHNGLTVHNAKEMNQFLGGCTGHVADQGAFRFQGGVKQSEVDVRVGIDRVQQTHSTNRSSLSPQTKNVMYTQQMIQKRRVLVPTTMCPPALETSHTPHQDRIHCILIIGQNHLQHTTATTGGRILHFS